MSEESMAQKIKPVESNKSKQKTYAKIMGKYKRAVENGFYGEAELIVYAYMEDRLRSFIYYSDGLDRWNSKTINENLKNVCGDVGSINDIGTKINIIKKLIRESKSSGTSKDEYIKNLGKVYKYAFNATEFKALLNKIDKWREYRNEVVHALLNKDLEDLHSTYKGHVEEGYGLARELDNIVNRLKRV